MKKKNKIDKKKELYKKLGAEKFQKLVFIVEKLKFKFLKKFVPNYIKYFDKYINKATKRRLKKANSETEKQEIIYLAKVYKMQERREFYQEENRNYHIMKEKPSQIVKYLELNKKIHEKGLLKNFIFICLIITGIMFGYYLVIPLLFLELISALINFECINLQNYNLYRLGKIIDKIKQREEKIKSREAEKYKDISKEIHEAIMEQEDIPTIDEILGRADNEKKLEELKLLLEKVKSERNISESTTEKGYQKSLK